MNKSIKYIIDGIVNFNPVDYDDGDIIDRDILNSMLSVPKTKNELS